MPRTKAGAEVTNMTRKEAERQTRQADYQAPERRKPLTASQRFAVNDRVGYAKAFLRNVGTPPTDEAWWRQGHVVAVSGDVTGLYPHWKTKQAQAVPEDLILVQWNDVRYPVESDDGERQYAHAVRNGTIAKIGSGRYAEDIP